MAEYCATGGLGDAAIAFLQLPSDATHVIHCEMFEKLLPSIAAFYTSQGIPNTVKLVTRAENAIVMQRPNYIKNAVNEFEAFPKIKFQKIEGIDVLINPISGRDRLRRLVDVKELMARYPHRHFTQTPWTDTSTVPHLVDLICSANVVISPEGFVAFFGGMAGKKVYTIGNEDIINRRRHKEWDFHRVECLAEIVL